MFIFVYLFSWYLEEVTFFHQLCSLILSGVSYKLALTKSISNDWTAKTFAICFYGEPCCYSCWPSTTPEGVQGGVRHSVLQGIWWRRSLDGWMFLGTHFMISNLASLLSREALSPFMVTSDPHDYRKTFLQNECFMALDSRLTRPEPYILTSACPPHPQALWSSLSGPCEMLPLGLQSSFCPKWNVTCNTQLVPLF